MSVVIGTDSTVSERAFLDAACRAASEGTDGKYRLGAVVVRSGNIVGVGTNRHRNYGLYDILERRDWSVHAEVSALRSAGNSSAGAVLYVVRLGRSGRLRMARPCCWCMSHALTAGIKKIVYSTAEGAVAKERLLVA